MCSRQRKDTRQRTDDRLAGRRRQQILDAAAPMFGKKGYAATDVQILADQLGIGKGTVYRYFPTKRKLFLAAVDRGMQQMHARVEAARLKGGDPLDQIARAIRAYLVFFDAHPELVELFIQERAVFKDRKKPTYFQHRDANMGPWVELFRQLIAAGRVRDMPIGRITDVVNDLLYGTMFTNYFVGRRKSFQAEAREILDVVFNGILTESERQRRSASGERSSIGLGRRDGSRCLASKESRPQVAARSGGTRRTRTQRGPVGGRRDRVGQKQRMRINP